jgi:hypothetical protein
MIALCVYRRRNKNMSKALSGRMLKAGAALAMALAVSFVTVAPGSAATRHHRVRVQDPPTYSRYYDYAPGQSDFTRGQLGLRTNPTIVPPGAYGPPDPASCGGFHC